MSLKDLKSKSDMALASISADRVAGEPRASRPITAPGATALMQPAMDALNDRAKKAEAKASELERRLAQQPTELALDALVEVPSRRRRLSDEQFEELKSNLANNPLVHPVAVKRRADGRFEIVSGHNRVAAFRALGRAAIPVVVVEIDDEKVDRSAFYANLLQPSLPDFEKFQGFREERERTGATQAALAREAGVSAGMVSMLFAFEQLPPAALDAIGRRPDCIGMACAAELAKLTREGRAEAVTEAVQRLSAGELAQKDAVGFVRRFGTVPPPPAPSTGPVKIRAGRSEYCQYVSRGSTLRIEFKTNEAREHAEAAINDLLTRLAAE